MKPMLLWVSNLLFIQISKRNTFVQGATIMYMTSTSTGGVMLDEIYTYEEIMTKYPDLKPAKDYHDYTEQWGPKHRF